MVSLVDVESEKADVLRGVLSAVLHNDLVHNVLAQVIDGLPIKSTYEFATTRRSEILIRTEHLRDRRDCLRRFVNRKKPLTQLS